LTAQFGRAGLVDLMLVASGRQLKKQA